MTYSVKFKTEGIEDWKQRLIDETIDLVKRHNKLGEVLFSDSFDKKVGNTQFNLMKKQFDVMTEYIVILSARLTDLNLVEMVCE
jgi:hypothetical protein